MKNTFFILLLFLLFSLFNCSEKKPNKHVKDIKEKLSLAEEIIESSIIAHGGDQLYANSFEFDFRGKSYSFTQNEKHAVYQLKFNQNDSLFIDKLDQGKFIRFVNGTEIDLNAKQVDQYSNALNSVMYFTLLPFKLKDPSVIMAFKGKTSIKNNTYHIVRVTFSADGGKDHEDEFYYWFNSENHRMEYFAYNYKVNEGGVRFRVAKNPREISGVLFYDYENYEAELGTTMEKLPLLYEKDELTLLSEIKNENIRTRKALF